jgi:hypothetical protein
MTAKIHRRLGCWALAVAFLAACASTDRSTEPAPVLRQHSGWTIRVTPSFRYSVNRWRARVDVWPPDRDYRTQAGINVRFSEEAWDQKVVVQSALAAAQRYIDASQTQHR